MSASSAPEPTSAPEAEVPGARIPLDVLGGGVSIAIGAFFFAFSGEDVRDWIWPRTLAQVLMVLGVVVLIGGLRPAGRNVTFPLVPRALRGRAALRRGDSDVLLFALGVIAYVVLMSLLGFWLVTFLVVAGAAMALDLGLTRRKRIVAVLVALALTVVGYVLFEIVFYVPFPGTPGLPF